MHSSIHDQVDAVVERCEALAHLSIALGTLAHDERLVLDLHYRMDLSPGEIARVLDTAEDAICQLRTRALHRLRLSFARENIRLFGLG